MKITAIYDNGGKSLDRYSVFTNVPFYAEGDPRKDVYNILGLNEGGTAFSQWSSGTHGRHCGKRVTFEDLSEETQEHIASRVFGDWNS